MVSYGGTGINNIQTTTLGRLIESISYGIHGSTNDKIEFARCRIFNFEYESWTPEHKKRIETLFIKHFYFSEIGYETEGRFFFELQNWFETNMPYWNKLLRSQVYEELIKNPFHNYELTDTTILESTKDMKEDVATKDDVLSKDDTSEEELTNKNVAVNRNVIDSDNNTITSTQTDTSEKDLTTTSKKTLETNETGSNTENTTKELDRTDSVIEDIVSSKDGATSEVKTSDTFHRQLESDTPQTRLVITPEADGSGTIEYASKIVENKQDSTENSNGTISEDETVGKTTNGTSNELDTTNQTGSNTNKIDTIDELELEEKEGYTNTTTNNTTELNEKNVDDVTTQDENGDIKTTRQVVGNVNSKGEKTANILEKNISSEKRHAVGSIGVARYDELLNGYREIFHNYDKMILDAAHPELFMLVY